MALFALLGVLRGRLRRTSVRLPAYAMWQHSIVAIRYHHQPSCLMSNKLAHIVHVADQITESTGMDIDGITLSIQVGVSI